MFHNAKKGKLIRRFIAFFIILNLTIGAWSVNEILSWLDKDIHFIFDMLIGLFLGEMSIPVAIVGWLLKLFNVF